MGRGFIWTPAKHKVVELTLQGGISQREMAERLGTTRRTLEGWMRRKGMRSELETRQKAMMEAFDAEFRAKYLPNSEEIVQHRAELEAKVASDTKIWLTWKTACFQAQRAHRKLPPYPEGID